MSHRAETVWLLLGLSTLLAVPVVAWRALALDDAPFFVYVVCYLAGSMLAFALLLFIDWKNSREQGETRKFILGMALMVSLLWVPALVVMWLCGVFASIDDWSRERHLRKLREEGR